MINIAILEDQLVERNVLEMFVKKYFKEKKVDFNVKSFSTSASFLACEEEFDLSFLDISMQGKSGMDVAHMMVDKGNKSLIVFVTTLAHYAIEGYSVNAVAYILKPYTYDTFVLKMHRVYEKLISNKKKEIFLNGVDGHQSFNVENILYIEANDHYLTYHLLDKEIVVRQTMSQAEMDLKEFKFFRIAKNIIINTKKIQRVKNDIVYINDLEFKISRSKKKEFISFYKN